MSFNFRDVEKHLSARSDEQINLSTRLGASQGGYESLLAEIFSGILSGEWMIVSYFDQNGYRHLLIEKNSKPQLGLSKKEREVLKLVILGHSNKFIALDLGMSSSTVATHIKRTLEKLGLHSRSEIIKLLPKSLLPKTMRNT